MRRSLVLLAVACGLLAIPAAAEAHNATVAVSCDQVSVSYNSFPAQPQTINWTVTVDGTTAGQGAFQTTGPSGSGGGSFTAPTTVGTHQISAIASWGTDGGGSASGSYEYVVEPPPCPGGGAPPCDQPPPPAVESVCRDDKVQEIPKGDRLPTDTTPPKGSHTGDSCAPPVTPPAPTYQDVCRGGELVPDVQVSPVDERLEGDTPGPCPVVVDEGPAEEDTPGEVEGKVDIGTPVKAKGGETPQTANPVNAGTEQLPFTGAGMSPWLTALLGLPLLLLGRRLRKGFE